MSRDSDLDFPDPRDGPDYEWIPGRVETVVTDGNMADWERDGRQIVAIDLDEGAAGDAWVHALDDDSWADLEALR